VNYTELDAIIAAGTGADVNPEFFTELKSNLLLALLKTGANANLPAYADNAAAIAGGLSVGAIYVQPSGAVYVVLEP
jgi:hypothetical protein